MRLLQRLTARRGGYVAPWRRHSPLLLLWKPIRKFLNVIVIPMIPFNDLRIGLYRLLGFKIGKHVFIGMRCYLDDVNPGLTRIGNYVGISYGVYFAVHGIHQDGSQPIEIGDGTYIGMRTTIVAGRQGVRIGRNCLVGAASVVTRSLPDHAVAVGVPARVLRYSDEVLSRRFHHHLGEAGAADLLKSSHAAAHASDSDHAATTAAAS